MAPALQTQSTTAAHAFARPLILWHLLSLDAPTVAALWTFFLAHHAGVALPVSSLAAMFLAVWILYAADRLLDTAAPAAEQEARHRFHARYRRVFLWTLAAASVALIPLLLRIPASSMRLFLSLAAILFSWFILIHVPPARPGARPRRLPKELAVGLFFAAATFIPTVARAHTLRLALLPIAILFALLCSLNCLFIYAWEHPTPRTRASAHPSSRLALRYLKPLAFTIAAAALTLALLKRSAPAFAIALSTAILLALQHRPPRNPTLLRAAADLALLTPLLFL